MTNFQIGAMYSFEVYAPSILTSSFKNVVAEGVLREAQAKQLGLDTRAMHARVFPYLPSGTPNDPSAYNYALFRTLTGETTILGIPWIRDSTVSLIDAQTLSIKIGNVDATKDIPIIRNALSQLGYNQVDISVM